MKLNPKHHNPELLEKIDEYYESYYDHNEYDSCFYDDQWDDEYYHSSYGYDNPDAWIEYTWLTTLDRATACEEDISTMEGCKVYIENEIVLDYELYTFGGHSKIVAFFGLIITVIKETKNPSNKIKKIHNTLCDRYPEIYIKLLDRI